MRGRGWSAYHAGEISERTAAIIDLVDEFPEGCGAGDLIDKIGISASSMRVYLWRICNYGYIERVGYGLWRPRGAGRR